MSTKKSILVFAIAFASASFAGDDYRIYLKHGAFEPKPGQAHQMKLAPGLTSAATEKLYLVQFKSTLSKKDRGDLAQVGAELHQYFPEHAYLVRIAPQNVAKVAGLSSVRWVGPYHPEFRLQDSVRQNLSVRGLSAKKFKLNVMPVALSDKKSIAETVKGLGGRILHMENNNVLMRVEIAGANVEKLSHLDEVLWIEPATSISNDIDNARIVGGANELKDLPSGYTGAGIKGHVMEGIYANHPDFGAGKFRTGPIAVADAAPDDHGSNTYGEIFGNGSKNPKARGILPDAQGFYTNNQSVYSGKLSRYDLVKKLISENGVMFQTASWGHDRTKEYTAESAAMDHLIFDLDIPITQSQSNSGTRDSRPQAWAKNIISVGGLMHYDNTDSEDDKWDGGGSIGPASDGRIKPDVSAFWDRILTTDGQSGYTDDFGGTSGATPIVAGYVGLTLQMWNNKVFPNTSGKAHATTIKALLINTARQWGFQGVDHDRTRAHQGWGFPNVSDMMKLAGKMLVVNETDLVKTGETKTYKVVVGATSPQFRATMVFKEPEATVPSTKQALNDLSLKVTDPKGKVFWGNNGLLESTTSTPGGNANTVDTVENVIIDKPAAGTYKVEVVATAVNVDTHKETAEMDADYALVVSGQ